MSAWQKTITIADSIWQGAKAIIKMCDKNGCQTLFSFIHTLYTTGFRVRPCGIK